MVKYNFLYNKNRTDKEQQKIFQKCMKYYELEMKNKNIIEIIYFKYLFIPHYL